MTSPISSVSAKALEASNTLANASFDELAKAHPEAANAAREFEAVFLRQLMSSVEKSTGLGKSSQTQGAVVGSMVVGALSDEMSAAGGIGLSDVILRAMLQHEPEKAPAESQKTSKPGAQAGPPAVP